MSHDSLFRSAVTFLVSLCVYVSWREKKISGFLLGRSKNLFIPQEITQEKSDWRRGEIFVCELSDKNG